MIRKNISLKIILNFLLWIYFGDFNICLINSLFQIFNVNIKSLQDEFLPFIIEKIINTQILFENLIKYGLIFGSQIFYFLKIWFLTVLHFIFKNFLCPLVMNQINYCLLDLRNWVWGNFMRFVIIQDFLELINHLGSNFYFNILKLSFVVIFPLNFDDIF